MIVLRSSVSQMQRSAGINRDAGVFSSDDIAGYYQRIDPPEDWRDVLIEASRNTDGMQPLTESDLGQSDDWKWWEDAEERDGYLTGIVYQVAQWAEESTDDEEEESDNE